MIAHSMKITVKGATLRTDAPVSGFDLLFRCAKDFARKFNLAGGF